MGEPHVLRICHCRILKGSEAGGLAEFPLAGEPGVEIARGPGRKTHPQLREVKLRVDFVAATGGGQAGQDGRRAATMQVTDEERIFLLGTTRFISRSPTLLSMGAPPSVQNTFSSVHWPSV